MEPLEVIVSTAITLFLSEASKEGGKNFSKATLNILPKLKRIIVYKLGTNEHQLRKKKREILEGEVLSHASQDEDFANQLRSFVGEEVRVTQIGLGKVRGKKLSVENFTQDKGENNVNSHQVIAMDVDVDGEISLSDVHQK